MRRLAELLAGGAALAALATRAGDIRVAISAVADGHPSFLTTVFRSSAPLTATALVAASVLVTLSLRSAPSEASARTRIVVGLIFVVAAAELAAELLGASSAFDGGIDNAQQFLGDVTGLTFNVISAVLCAVVAWHTFRWARRLTQLSRDRFWADDDPQSAEV